MVKRIEVSRMFVGNFSQLFCLKNFTVITCCVTHKTFIIGGERGVIFNSTFCCEIEHKSQETFKAFTNKISQTEFCMKSISYEDLY